MENVVKEVGRLLTQEQTVNRTTILDTDSSEDTRLVLYNLTEQSS